MRGISNSTAPPRQRRDLRLSDVLSYAICGIVALITATPFVWMALGSLKNATEVIEYPPTFFPREFAWNNYAEVFTSVPFLRYIFNSFLVASTVTLVALVFHSMAAYSLARLRYPGRRVLFLVIVSTLMIPVSITLIPTFIIVRSFGWLDTYWALIVPALVQCLWDFSFATILPQLAIGAGRGRQNRWGFAGRSISLYCSSFEPSHSGDTCRLFLACQLEQLPLAVDRDSISGDASHSAWDCLVRRRTFNSVAAHHGRLHRCRDSRADLIRISSELSDRRYQTDRSQIIGFPNACQFRSFSTPGSRQVAGRPLASLFQF